MIPKVLTDNDKRGDRVVSFKLSDDSRTVTIMEECDSYFYVDLTKDQFAAFITELQALHAKMA